MCMLSHFRHFQLFATLWAVAPQAPLSMGYSRQEYWSGFPCLPLGDIPDPGIEPATLTSPALAGGFLPLVPPGKIRDTVVYMQHKPVFFPLYKNRFRLGVNLSRNCKKFP